jgi:hypothetical protein
MPIGIPDDELPMQQKEAEESTYEYLGDLSATPPWHSRSMACHNCRVSWTGCWDNFQCPKCGMGELPGYEGSVMTVDEMKEMHESFMAKYHDKFAGEDMAFEAIKKAKGEL